MTPLLRVFFSVCRHVSQSDKPSKRYRNVHADVFVIADEDEENGTKLFFFLFVQHVLFYCIIDSLLDSCFYGSNVM